MMQKSRVRLTAGKVADFTCPAGKSQDFLWDTESPALALRATPTGRKTYVFESRLHGETVRIPIGTAAANATDANGRPTSRAMLPATTPIPRDASKVALIRPAPYAMLRPRTACPSMPHTMEIHATRHGEL